MAPKSSLLPTGLLRLAVAAVLVLVAGCGPVRPGYGDPVDGFRCDATGNEPVIARVSLHLVTADGQRVPATMGVGSTGSCNYAVRTEQEEGVVVVRGQNAAAASLETFLTIWEYAIPEGSGGASEFRAAADAGRIRVNGNPVAVTADGVGLNDGDEIELLAP